MKAFLALIFVCFIAFGNAIAAASDSLLLVQVVFRHGDRSPSHPYPTDPNNAFWTEGFSQLTNLGKQQQYELGQYLKSRYSDFLNNSYYFENAWFQSSEVDRCLMSITCNVAGLYPPAPDEVWDSTFPWQPLPIHTMPADEDYWLDHNAPCPNYDALEDEQMNSNEMKAIDEEYQELYAILTKETGLIVSNIFDASDIYDTTHCEIIHNLTIPSWITPDILNQMQECNYLIYIWESKTKEMQRLKGGPTIGLMSNYMKDKINGNSPGLQIALWSTHETNLAAILNALDVYNGITPPYSASLILELYLTDGNYNVQIFYRNDTTVEPHELTLPGCSSPCPYETFQNLIYNVIPVNIQEECGA